MQAEAKLAAARPGALPPSYSGGQVARGGQIGLLGNRDFMDTPFNITSYTAKKIEDQQASTIADVVSNDPSVRFTGQTGGILDSFFIRGFPIGEGNVGEIAFNGVYGVAPNYRVFTDYVERIEIIKGPTALLYGMAPNSSVGGTINIVPKRASDVDLTRVTTDYATNSQFGTHLDVSRRFGENREFEFASMAAITMVIRRWTTRTGRRMSAPPHSIIAVRNSEHRSTSSIRKKSSTRPRDRFWSQQA